jgi:hypothetical protein
MEEEKPKVIERIKAWFKGIKLPKLKLPKPLKPLKIQLPKIKGGEFIKQYKSVFFLVLALIAMIVAAWYFGSARPAVPAMPIPEAVVQIQSPLPTAEIIPTINPKPTLKPTPASTLKPTPKPKPTATPKPITGKAVVKISSAKPTNQTEEKEMSVTDIIASIVKFVIDMQVVVLMIMAITAWAKSTGKIHDIWLTIIAFALALLIAIPMQIASAGKAPILLVDGIVMALKGFFLGVEATGIYKFSGYVAEKAQPGK